MKKVEGSLSFSALAGIDGMLLPFLFAKFGNPAAGISEFASRMVEAKKEVYYHSDISDDKLNDDTPETFITKLEKLRAQSPQDYEAFRMFIAPNANVAAGSDTTSISLVAILHNIIKEPRVHKKLREELRDAGAQGKADDPITFSQAQALPYLQMVIKEAMRLHPVTGLPLWRVVQQDGVEIAGTHFPENVSILDFWQPVHIILRQNADICVSGAVNSGN